uniref:O-antigen polymerase n=1 Tax=Chlorobium phaeovibrioides (strain DSM 265 / 1930) TaxID=290318 RepID=A4SDV2_CHLPM
MISIKYKIKRIKCDWSSLYLASLFFVVLNAPSLKAFMPSMGINVAPLFLMLLYAIVKGNSGLDKARKLYILLLTMFFALLFLSGLFHGVKSFSYIFLLKYLVVWVSMVVSALLVTKKSVEYFLFIVVFFGVIMAFLVLRKSGDISDLNYLQIGHPIAISLIVTSVFFFKSQVSFFKLILLLFIGYLFLALMSLYGRSPILFPIIVLVLLPILKVFWDNKFLFLVVISFVFISGRIVANLILFSLPEHISNRVLRMIENPGDEPRFELWGRALDYIYLNPFGYGLESSWHLLGYTPHNFILEVLLSSGIVGLVPYLVLLMIWFYLGLKSLNCGAFAVAIFGASLYYFLRFQVGGAIGSSYDFFILILLTISYSGFSRKECVGS